MNRHLLKTTTLVAVAVGVAVGCTFAGAQTPPKGPPAPQAGKKGRGGPKLMGPTSASPAGGPATAAAPLPPPRVHHKGSDPFYIPWTVPPPPPYVFDKILPVRVADPDVEPAPVKPITIREEPALRVSGIMTGDGVFAILEQSNKVDIVKPGSSVDIATSGGSRTYTVVTIKEDTVVLESKEGLTTYQQTVPLSDAPLGTSSASFGRGGGPGFGPGAPMTGGGPGASAPSPGGPMAPGGFGGGRGRRSPSPGGGAPGV